MQINPGEVLYVFVLGLILYIILKRQLFDPIGEIIQNREDVVEGARDFIETAEQRIENLKHELDSALSDNATEAYQIQEKARQDANEKRKELLTFAQEEAGKMLGEARKEIHERTEVLESSLKRRAREFAFEIADMLLGRKMEKQK